jgi:hypothetical protein
MVRFMDNPKLKTDIKQELTRQQEEVCAYFDRITRNDAEQVLIKQHIFDDVGTKEARGYLESYRKGNER